MNSDRKYIVLLVLVMLATMRHSASVYLSISPARFSSDVLNWLYAVSVVSVLDLVVIVFTVEGSKRLPIVYAVGLGILSGLYFLDYAIITSVVGSIVFMILIPLAGYEFAELFKAKRTRSDEDRTHSEDYRRLNRDLSSLKDELSLLFELWDKKDAKVHDRLDTLIEVIDDARTRLQTVADTAAQQAEDALAERFRKRLERIEKKLSPTD